MNDKDEIIKTVALFVLPALIQQHAHDKRYTEDDAIRDAFTLAFKFEEAIEKYEADQ